MGYTTSMIHGIEVPNSSEANDVPEDIGKVVTALEGGSINRRLTSAAIAALTAPQKPAGVYFHNTTTGKLMVSDGTNVVEPYGMWQSWTCAVTASTTSPTGVTQVNTAYTRIGNTIHARAALVIPYATRGSGAYSFSLPVTPVSDYYSSTARCPIGGGVWGHVSDNTAYCHVTMASATTVTLLSFAADTAFASTAMADTTVRFQITYEAA